MRGLNSKQKLGLYVSFYVFGLVATMTIIVLISGWFYYLSEARKEASVVTFEVANGGEADLNKTSDILTASGYSGMVFDQDKKRVLSFGLLADYEGSGSNIPEISNSVNSIFNRGRTIEKMIGWGDLELFTYFIPIKSGNRVLGAVLMGRPVKQIKILLSIFMIVMVVMGLGGMWGGYLLGERLAGRLLAPLANLNEVIESVDRQHTAKTIHIREYVGEELTGLVNRINQMMERLRK